jgi:structural maintenance of chromosome 2
LYNEKKKEALRTILKKEEKVKEINELLRTEIEPQMEKLRKVSYSKKKKF